MAKPCAWCGKSIGDTDRICPGCLSAQPTTGSGGGAPAASYAPPSQAPPPGYGGPPPVHGGPPPGYGAAPPPYPYPPGQRPGGSSSNTGRVVAIVIGASVAAVVGIALLAILAVTFLGTNATSEFSEGAVTAADGSRDYPADVRRNFMSACSVNSPQSVCSCALEEIEDEYTLAQFADLERQLADRDGQLTPTLQSIVLRCASGG